MPRRRRRFDPILPTANGTPLRVALYDVVNAIDDVLRAWVADDERADALRLATVLLGRDGRVAIVVFDSADELASVREASRAAALSAALRVNAALASAYQERWAPPRTILSACHAVARLIEIVRPPTPVADAVAARWN